MIAESKDSKTTHSRMSEDRVFIEKKKAAEYFITHPNCSGLELSGQLGLTRGTADNWLALFRGEVWALTRRMDEKYKCICGSSFKTPGGLEKHKVRTCIHIFLPDYLLPGTAKGKASPNGGVKEETTAKPVKNYKLAHRAPTFEETLEAIIAAFEGATKVPKLEKSVVHLERMLAATKLERDLFEKQLQEQIKLGQRYRLAQQQGEFPGGNSG